MVKFDLRMVLMEVIAFLVKMKMLFLTKYLLGR